MSEALRKRALYVLLGLAVVWGVYNYNQPTKSGGSVPPSAVPAAAQAGTPSNPTAQIKIADAQAKPWGVDPFRVKVKQVARGGPAGTGTGPAWTVSGIVFSETQPLAIINNRPVGIGDKVNGATVLDINKRQVTLEAGSKRFTLTVAPKG